MGIDFKIYYRSGGKNSKPDALSRRAEYHSEKGGSGDQLITMILHKKHFADSQPIASTASRENLIFIISAVYLDSLPAQKWSKDFLELVQEVGKKDTDYCKALGMMEKDVVLTGSVLDS